MTTPATIFTLKTRCVHPPLVLTWTEGAASSPDVLDCPLLMWGASVDDAPRFEVAMNYSKRSVRQALSTALQIARDIRSTPGGVISDHDVYADRIADFATQFGTLWGDLLGGPISHDPEKRIVQGSLRDWYSELLDLLDAVELKNAIVGKRENRAFRKRLAYDEAGRKVFYLMHSKRPLFLASKGQAITIERPGLPVQNLDMWDIAQGTSRLFGWATLSTMLETKLNGHINVGLHPTDMTSIAIMPSGILPTLFAQVWLDTLSRNTVVSFVRNCQGPNCNHELPAGSYANKRYCGIACQKADWRRLRDRPVTA